MAPIKEDYCSYEVAKLLKEKGFDIPVWTRYENDDESNEVIFGSEYNWNNSPMGQISAPTHQMAMKWLREKGVQMSIDTIISSSDGDIYFNIDTYSEDSGWDHPVNFYDSYEEAIEDAIKYSLKNLI